MKTKGLLLDKDGSHYSFSEMKELASAYVMLYRSKYGDWTPPYKGQLACAIADNGDEVEIRIGDKVIRLDFSEVSELHLLLQEYYCMINQNNMKRVVIK